MKRRWFGVFLMTWASVASLLAYAPAALAAPPNNPFNWQADGRIMDGGRLYYADIGDHINYRPQNVGGGGFLCGPGIIVLNASGDQTKQISGTYYPKKDGGGGSCVDDGASVGITVFAYIPDNGIPPGCPGSSAGPVASNANYPCPNPPGGAVINGVYDPKGKITGTGTLQGTLTWKDGNQTGPCANGSFVFSDSSGLNNINITTDANGHYKATGLQAGSRGQIQSGAACKGNGKAFSGDSALSGVIQANKTTTLDAVFSSVVPTSGTDPNAAPQVDCDAGAFSWLICSAIELLKKMVDGIRDSVIIPFLQEKPLDDPAYLAAQQLWAALRNVALVFLILVFFMVVIGTALGLDNYTIKKTLPRLIAAAILLPFSWYICMVAVDIGNILGQGLLAIANGIPALKVDIRFTSLTSFFAIGGALLVAGAALTAMSFGVLITIFIACMSVLLTLIFRKVLLVVLIVLSPVAVLAWILPNTEKLFKTWWTNLFKVVLMYPIVMLLFIAGQIFAAVFPDTTKTVGFNSADVRPLFQVLALFLPLFLVPKAFQWAGSAMGAGAGLMGRLGGAANSRYGKDSTSAKERHDRFTARRATTASDPTKGRFSRALARKQSGTGGLLMPQTLSQRQKMRELAAKHTSLQSSVRAQDKAEEQLKATAADLQAAGDNEAAEKIRSLLSVSGRTKLQTLGATQELIAKQAALAGYEKADEISPHDTARALSAGATVASENYIKQRVAEAGAREDISFTDDAGNQVSLGGRMNTVEINSETIPQLRRIAEQALANGDQATAIAAMQNLGRGFSGREELVKMKHENFGGTDDQVVATEHKAMWDRMVADVNDAGVPDLKRKEGAAFKAVSSSDFQKMDFLAQKRYLNWVSQPEHAEQTSEAAAAISNAGNDRNIGNLSDGSVSSLHSFMDTHRDMIDPRSQENLDNRKRRLDAAAAPGGTT